MFWAYLPNVFGQNSILVNGISCVNEVLVIPCSLKVYFNAEGNFREHEKLMANDMICLVMTH